MPLYHVPILLVVRAATGHSAEEVVQRIVDNLVGLRPDGLEGVDVINNLGSYSVCSPSWFDQEHFLVKTGNDKFTLRSENAN